MKKYGDCIITNSKLEILLLQRAEDDGFEPGVWCLPGGKIEQGETDIEGATRELFEETNIDCELEGPVHEEDRGDNISYYFEGSVSDDVDITLDDTEHSASMWVSVDDLTDYDLILDLGDILSKILDLEEDTLLFERFKVLAGL